MSASYPDITGGGGVLEGREGEYAILYLLDAFRDVVYSKLVELAGTKSQAVNGLVRLSEKPVFD